MAEAEIDKALDEEAPGGSELATERPESCVNLSTRRSAFAVAAPAACADQGIQCNRRPC